MQISPIKYCYLINTNFNSLKSISVENQKNFSISQKSAFKELTGYSNISFGSILLPQISLKKSAQNYLRVSQLCSTPLENISCKLLNKRKFNAYNIDQMEYPYGSIGAKTDFSDLIQSRDFYQCAGLAILDRKENQQFLAHRFHKTYIEDIYETLINVFSPQAYKEKQRLDIWILPGCEKDTKYTVNHILKALDMVDEGLSSSVYFVHFNRKNYGCLCVNNGGIFASDNIYKYALTNTDNMYYFNNPEYLDAYQLKLQMSKAVQDENTADVCKANRVYKDFKKEIK